MLDFLFVFNLIFGFKIGFIDISVLIPFVILVFKGYRLFFDRFIISVLIFLGFLCCYQIVVQLCNGNFSLEVILRVFRSAIVIILVHVFVTSYKGSVLNVMFNTLLCHSLIIIFFAFNYPLAVHFSELLDQKPPRLYRSTGLLSGFDMAGLLNLLALLIVFVRQEFKLTTIFNIFIILISCILTSRTTFVFAFLIVTLIFFTIHKKNVKWFVKLLAYIFISCCVSLLGFLVYQVYLLTVGGPSLIPYELYVNIFALNTGDELYDMFFLPSTSHAIIFGLGVEPGDLVTYSHSDVGYVREIFKYGVLGLVSVLCIHFFILFESISYKKNNPTSKLLVVLLIFILLLSFKNNYFFTRAIFPCFMLIALTCYKIKRLN